MSDIAKIVGQRIRKYRTAKGLSQEKLAELSGCHPTYVGQIERGEKNVTIESVEKIAVALGVSLATIFENLGGKENGEGNLVPAFYEFLLTKTKEEQEYFYRILLEVERYKNG